MTFCHVIRGSQTLWVAKNSLSVHRTRERERMLCPRVSLPPPSWDECCLRMSWNGLKLSMVRQQRISTSQDGPDSGPHLPRTIRDASSRSSTKQNWNAPLRVRATSFFSVVDSEKRELSPSSNHHSAHLPMAYSFLLFDRARLLPGLRSCRGSQKKKGSRRQARKIQVKALYSLYRTQLTYTLPIPHTTTTGAVQYIVSQRKAAT